MFHYEAFKNHTPQSYNRTIDSFDVDGFVRSVESTRAGHIHGATDPAGGKIDSMDKDAIRVADIHTTVQHALGIEYNKELLTPIGRPMALSNGQVIKTLLKIT